MKFNWYDVDEGKLNLNFNNRIFVQIGIYAKEDFTTSHIEELYPMVNISDTNNFSIALNMSNAFMLSTILSLYVEPDTIKEYFNRTNLSNGWYVSQKYIDKPVYNKTLTDKITLKLIPITDHRKIPMYKVRFIKTNNSSIEMDLTKAEMRSLSTLLSMFSANASIYSFIFRQTKQYKYVENQLKSLESTNSILRSILDKLSSNQISRTSKQINPIVVDTPDVDFTNIDSVEVNNVDLVKKVKTKNKKTSNKSDVININDLEVVNKESESEVKFKELVEDKTGVQVSNKDSFDSIDIRKLIPKEGEDVEVIEPVMNRSVIDIDTYRSSLINRLNNNIDILHEIAKKTNVDRRTKNQSIVYSIAKQGLLDPKELPTLLNNRGMLGIPATSVIHSASIFASCYKYLSNHSNDTDLDKVAKIAYRALQMSQVESSDIYDNNEELKQYSNTFTNIMIKMLLPKDMGITGIRTLDKYISLNHSEEEVYYNYSDLDVEVVNEDLKYLVSGLTDIYFLLWYGENKYIKDVKLSNSVGYLMDVVNVPMYELTRSILINIVVKDISSVTSMVKHTLDFEDMVKYSTWDMETFKEAYIDLYAFYYKVLNMIKTKEEIYRGMPCFS